ncbi:MAG: zinc ribbon domain-containing protein [Oscillospiraceae bacterium]|nr:zinc ribbon domain-containing protein [Oscillospiraceae bacterium]
MICPNCGKETADSTAFCKECGASLAAAAQPAAPVQPAQPVPPAAPMPYGAPPQAPVQTNTVNLIIAVVMLLCIGFLVQGLFTGTMFKFIGKPDGKMDKFVEKGGYNYNSYSITETLLNDNEAYKLYPDANDKAGLYYQSTGYATAEFMNDLSGGGGVNAAFIVTMVVSGITVFIAAFFQIAALVHICRKKEDWAWKRMKTTSIWVLISKIVGVAAVLIVSGQMNDLKQNNATRSTGLYAALQNGKDIMTIAPQAWITLILSIAAVVVCCIFRSRTKQEPQAQQPAVPVQPVQ